MKANVAVDSLSKLFHTVLGSAASVTDRDAPTYLLHGRETRVWGNLGYQGPTEMVRRCAPAARDCAKARVRVKVAHSIGVLKRVFGLQKVRYRGLAKNLHNLEVTAALANRFMVR